MSALLERLHGERIGGYEAIVNLIAATTNAGGLRVKAKLDRRAHPKGISISDETMLNHFGQAILRRLPPGRSDRRTISDEHID